MIKGPKDREAPSTRTVPPNCSEVSPCGSRIAEACSTRSVSGRGLNQRVHVPAYRQVPVSLPGAPMAPQPCNRLTSPALLNADSSLPMAMMPFPPGRFATTICWPHTCVSRSPPRRLPAPLRRFSTVRQNLPKAGENSLFERLGRWCQGGALGWVSDASGYRYSAVDPESGRPWPSLPDSFLGLATAAAERAGFGPLHPDACLVNRYAPGARLTLHQDKDELDLEAPIVSVSLGIPAVFLFGGLTRKERPQRVPVQHGDVVVWGGPSRLRFHGVRALEPASHPLTGGCRMNLTFRKTR